MNLVMTLVFASVFAAGVSGQTLDTTQPPSGQQDHQEASDAVTTGKSIHQMFLDDQSEVPTGRAPLSSGEEFERRGRLRRERVRQLLEGGDVSAATDFHDAALLFQHGEVADDYLLAHILAMEAVLKGDDRSKWLAAATLDRYLQLIKQPQIFGTQYPLDPSVARPGKNVSGGNFMGRTQEPFNDRMVPAQLRHDFCVADLSQQRQILATLNSGKYPAAMIAPGCRR